MTIRKLFVAAALACLPGMASAGLISVDFDFTGDGPDNLPSAVFTGDDSLTTVTAMAATTNPVGAGAFPTLTRTELGLGVCSSFTEAIVIDFGFFGSITVPAACNALEDSEIDGSISDDSIVLIFDSEVTLEQMRFGSAQESGLFNDGDQFDLLVDGAVVMNDEDASPVYNATTVFTGQTFAFRADEANDDFYLAGLRVRVDDGSSSLASPAVPVPATLGLFGLSLICMRLARSRRSRLA